MVSRDTIDRMVDGTDDQSEVQQNPMEQGTETAPSSAQEMAGEIALEQDFTVANYGYELGGRTLTRYYSAYFIPEEVVLSGPEDTRALKAPTGNIALYEKVLMTGLRFLVPSFFRELLLCLGLALGQLMPNAWQIAIGCMILWELTFKEEHHLTLKEFFHCYCPKV